MSFTIKEVPAQKETYRTKFLKMFPNAVLDISRLPRLCPEDIGWKNLEICQIPGEPDWECRECWEQEYVEEK